MLIKYDMAQRTLDIRQFTLHPRYDKTYFYPLGDVKNTDLYELLKQSLSGFINQIDKEWNKYSVQESEREEENEGKRAITIAKTKNKENKDTEQIYFYDDVRFISGKISTGLYGKAGFIIDENKNVLFEKQVNHALPKPFYFMICVPAYSDTGYIITEKDGIYGFSQGLCIILQAFVRTYFPEVVASYRPFIEDQLISKFLNKGVFSEVTLTTTVLPKHLEESYGVASPEGEEYTVELKITPRSKKAGITGKLKENIQNRLHQKNSPVIDFEKGFEEIGFDNDSKVTVKSLYNGHQRTIQMNHSHPIRPLYKIEVKTDADGHSNFGSIEEETFNLLESLHLKLFQNGN